MDIYKTNKKDKIIYKDMKNLFFHKIGGIFVFNTDLILISKFISLKIVGIYASYQMIYKMLIAFEGVITQIITPRIGKFIAEQNSNKVFNLWKKLNILFIYISIILSYCFYNLSNDFVSLWLGKENTLTKSTVLLITINLYIHLSRVIIGIFKETNGFFDDTYAPILEATINFIFSIILIQYIGLNGVIIGTIISNIIVILIIKPILVFKRCFKKTVNDYILIYLNYLILIFLSVYLSNNIIEYLNIINVINYKSWLMKSIEIAIIVSSVSFLVFLSNKDFRKFLIDLRKK